MTAIELCELMLPEFTDIRVILKSTIRKGEDFKEGILRGFKYNHKKNCISILVHYQLYYGINGVPVQDWVNAQDCEFEVIGLKQEDNK